jgi:hypothetical protein
MSDPPANPVGTLIRSARELQVPKMSIRAAAARIGLSPEQWGNIERGYRYAKEGDAPREFAPPAPTIAKMASIVGVTPAQLTAAGRADAAAALEEIRRRDQLSSPLAAVPESLPIDGNDAKIYDIVLHSLNDDLERMIWQSRHRSVAERIAAIEGVRNRQAELAAELDGEDHSHGIGLAVVT